MIQPCVRKLEYVGIIGVMNRAIDVYESPLRTITLFDGIGKVKCRQSDLDWLICTMADSIYGWKERRLVQVWI